MSKLLEPKSFVFMLLIAQILLPSRIEGVLISQTLPNYELVTFEVFAFALALFVSVLVKFNNNLKGTKKDKAIYSLDSDDGTRLQRTVRE